MKPSRILIYLAVLAASLAYLSAWHAADQVPGATPSGEGLMAPLDDAYIFGQYARQALHGQWLHYTPGAPISTGVSSFSWLLALTALMGLGWPVTWAAWALGLACLTWSVHSLFRLSARLFPALPDWLLPLLFLTHASSVSLYFQGMDSGLLLAALFAAAEAALEPKAPWKFWGLGALLAFTRPEGQIVLPALACARAWEQGLSARIRALALGLAVAALPTLGLWTISGSPIPDSVRPKTAFMDAMSLPERALTAARFAGDVSSRILMGLAGQGEVGVAGHAAAGNDPAKHFPIFSLLIAAFGVGWAWRKGSHRAWWGALLCAWVLTLGLLSWTLPVGWHHHRYLAPLWPLMLLGLASALQHLRQGDDAWQRGARGAIAVLWLGFGLIAWQWFPFITFWSASNYALANREAAYQLRALPGHGRIAVEDAGLLAYYSGRPTVDLLGVTDHRFALLQTAGPGAVLQELKTRLPMTDNMMAVLHPRRTGSYSSLWAVGPLTPVAELGDMVLYGFDWGPKKK